MDFSRRWLHQHMDSYTASERSSLDSSLLRLGPIPHTSPHTSVASSGLLQPQ